MRASSRARPIIEPVISGEHDQMLERMETHYDASLNEHVNKEKLIDPEETKAIDEKRAAMMKKVLERVRDHTGKLKNTEMRKAFTKENLLSEKNLRKAISEVKKNTVPARDGFTTSFFSDTKEESWKQLKALFEEIWDDALMTDAMREAVISCVYK